MRIDFDDGGWIEIVRAKTPGKVIVTVAAKDGQNSLTKHINSAEVTDVEFAQLAQSISQEEATT